MRHSEQRSDDAQTRDLAPARALGRCPDDPGGGGLRGRRRQRQRRRQGEQLKTIRAGTLTVGSDIPYQPFEFGRAPDYQGFDVDVVNEIAKRLDLDVKFVKTPFDTIFRNLAQGKFDMVASAATITAEREKDGRLLGPLLPRRPVADGQEGKRHQDGRRPQGQGHRRPARHDRRRLREGQDRREDRAHLRPDRRRVQRAGGRSGRGRDQRLPGLEVRRAAQPRDLEVVEAIPTSEQYGFAFAKRLGRAARRPSTRSSPKLKDDGTLRRSIYNKWFGTDPCKGLPAKR